MSMRIRLIAVNLLFCVLVATSVRAQEGRSPEALKQLSGDALKEAQSGNLKKAIAIWEDILDEVPEKSRADIHANLAVAFKMDKQLPQSWHHLTRYLAALDKPDPKGEKERRKLETSLGKTHGLVELKCEPEGAVVHIEFMLPAADGTPPVGQGKEHSCPLAWWFAAGEQSVMVSAPGYQPKLVQVAANLKGRPTRLTAVLDRQPDEFGVLVVEGKGKAIQVFLNGMLEGKVPFKRKLKTGDYDLMVGKPGEMPWKKKITITAGQTLVEKPAIAQPKVVKVDPKVDKPPDNSITKPVESDKGGKSSAGAQWALIGGGVGVAVVGAILQGVGYSRHNDLLDKYPGDETDYDKWFSNQQNYQDGFEEEVKPLSTAAYVLYGVGGAAAAAGLIWLIADAGKGGKANKAVKVAPWMDRGGAGAVWSFDF